MKLIYRIVLRLSLLLLPLLTLWAALFYVKIMDEIRDEVDDALEEYSERIIVRMLAGQELPPLNSGSNNSYTITPIDAAHAVTHPRLSYHDAEVYIPGKEETEPARILTTLFRGQNDGWYELKVATPTFEKDDLLETILWWVVALYAVLLVSIVTLTTLVFYGSMKPLYALLHWLREYVPGHGSRPIPNHTNITEFRRLNVALQQAVDRSETLHERQAQFIGNASHELQTPLAVMGSRMEWMLEHMQLNEEQMGELLRILQTQRHATRLNKTLLLLTKIDNAQFPESVNVDLAAQLRELCESYNEIYAPNDIRCELVLPESFCVQMDQTLASVLTANLLRNAYLHSAHGAQVLVRIEGRTLSISNDGREPLNAEHLFDRFFQGTRREGSTGLGLALVDAVARCYGLRVEYCFEQGQHHFCVTWP